MMQRVVLLVLVALALALAHEDHGMRGLRYGLGDPNVQCWTRPYPPTDDPVIPAICPPPEQLNINFTGVVPLEYIIGEQHNISFFVFSTLDDISSVPHITHANVHACTQAAGFCSPILAESPGLVSFYGQATANLSSVTNQSVVTSPVEFSSAGIWTLICHGRIIRGVAPAQVQWDFAYGFSVTVKKPLAHIHRDAVIAMGVLGGIVGLIALVFLVGVIFFRRHKVIRAASFPFCVCIIIGAGLVLSTIIPLSVSPVTNSSCVAIPWLLSPATFFVLCLLALRLYRVQVLFGEAALHPDMKRYWYLRNIYLLSAAFLITGVQLIMLVIWTAITDWRPRRVNHDSDSAAGFACGSNNTKAMPALYWTLVALDVICIIAGVTLAFLTRKVTTLFNESKAIALVTYTFVFIGCVIVPIQTIVSDVNATYVLRCIGIILGVGAALIVLFGPKFWVIFTANRNDLRGADFTGSSSYSRNSAESSTEMDNVASPKAEGDLPPTRHADKKTIDRLDAATSRAMALLEKHKTGFRVGTQEIQEVIDGLKAV